MLGFIWIGCNLFIFSRIKFTYQHNKKIDCKLLKFLLAIIFYVGVELKYTQSHMIYVYLIQETNYIYSNVLRNAN